MPEIANGKQIMIVDDDEFLHRVMSRILKLGGFNVVAQAYNGLEAFRMYHSLNPKPNIIIMDHRMPVMDGITATKEILRINPSAKIVFVSADESAKDTALAVGAVEFLVKPVRSKELFAVLRNINDS